MMKTIGFLKMATLVAPLALSVACASSKDDAAGDGDGDTAGDGDGDVVGDGDGDVVGDGDGDGDGTGTGGSGDGDGDGDGTGGGDGDGDGDGAIMNPFLADWDLLAMQPSDSTNLDQCMGFTDGPGSPYRVYGVDDPNPKDGDPCDGGAGNTSAMDGSCNVPAGFEREGVPIGNKNCACVGGVFDCSTAPLPGVTFGTPGACEDLGAGPKGTYAENNDEQPCTAEFDTCMTLDLPESSGDPLSCEYTTPKGCVCLADASGALIWQCASTNSWFDCAGDACPWDNGLTSGADIKTNCGLCGEAVCD